MRHGRGLDGRVDLEGIRRVLEQADPHWVGLQEVDGGRRRSGGIHQAAWLGSALGRPWFFHATVQWGGPYGLAWFGPPATGTEPGPGARGTVLRVDPQRLPSRGEPRACLWLQVAAPDGRDEPAWLGVTHLGLSAAERVAQARALAERAARLRRAGPVVLVGDFNAPADAPELAPLRQVLTCALAGGRTAPTYPATGGEAGRPRWVGVEPAAARGAAIDLIWVAGWQVRARAVLDHAASDHRLVMAILQRPEPAPAAPAPGPGEARRASPIPSAPGTGTRRGGRPEAQEERSFSRRKI
ncbi:MAG TPA: endonuclease/exonuclease/phosphatase family protein [Thermaerobacter sp.]